MRCQLLTCRKLVSLLATGYEKTEPLCFTAYNIRNIGEITAKFGTNQLIGVNF